ncbi:MAG: hypothetical protein AAGE52_00370 [Myxococcota bacterium]
MNAIQQTLIYRFGGLTELVLERFRPKAEHDVDQNPLVDMGCVDGGRMVLCALAEENVFQLSAEHPDFDVTIVANHCPECGLGLVYVERFRGDPAAAVRWISALRMHVQMPDPSGVLH